MSLEYMLEKPIISIKREISTNIVQNNNIVKKYKKIS